MYLNPLLKWRCLELYGVSWYPVSALYISVVRTEYSSYWWRNVCVKDVDKIGVAVSFRISKALSPPPPFCSFLSWSSVQKTAWWVTSETSNTSILSYASIYSILFILLTRSLRSHFICLSVFHFMVSEKLKRSKNTFVLVWRACHVYRIFLLLLKKGN